MTNQEQYEILCEKAEKYDRLMKAFYDVRSEIIVHRGKTHFIDRYDLVGDCLDIINKRIFEMEELQ